MAPPVSTPELTSTANGRDSDTARATLFWSNPPARMKSRPKFLARDLSKPVPDPAPPSSRTMSAGERLAASMSRISLTTNDFVTRTPTSPLMRDTYSSSSEPWSWIAPSPKTSVMSATFSTSSSTKTPTEITGSGTHLAISLASSNGTLLRNPSDSTIPTMSAPASTAPATSFAVRRPQIFTLVISSTPAPSIWLSYL